MAWWTPDRGAIVCTQRRVHKTRDVADSRSGASHTRIYLCLPCTQQCLMLHAPTPFLPSCPAPIAPARELLVWREERSLCTKEPSLNIIAVKEHTHTGPKLTPQLHAESATHRATNALNDASAVSSQSQQSCALRRAPATVAGQSHSKRDYRATEKLCTEQQARIDMVSHSRASQNKRQLRTHAPQFRLEPVEALDVGVGVFQLSSWLGVGGCRLRGGLRLQTPGQPASACLRLVWLRRQMAPPGPRHAGEPEPGWTSEMALERVTPPGS